MARRTVLLVSALVVAALGTLLVFLYVRGVDDRALDEQNPVEVLVASQEIPAGTSASAAAAAGSFDQLPYPEDSVPPGAVSSITALGDRVARTTIVAGEIILDAKFGDEVDEVVETAVPPGRIAISVNMADPNRVAPFLTVGSNVAVFATTPRADGTGSATQLLLPNVEVLAIGTDESSSDDDTITDELPRQLITLSLTQEEAQRVIFAQSVGELYLGLLGAETTVAPDGGIDAANLFP